MALNYAAVQVEASGGVLRIGSEAYPLRGITRVGQRKLVPREGAAWKKFFVRTLISLFLGAIMISIWGGIWTFALIAILALLTWQLVSALQTPPLYGLVIATAGVQHDAVWGTDKAEIDQLIFKVTQAVGQPDAAQLFQQVNHAVHIGDQNRIYQEGDGNIGIAKHRGSGDNVAGG
ncbi:DUF6232 family protein [Nonomuraea sp. NEAU-A123]|uniref:DUF6232 family protein n=1 Tax=Nonomuraea sp. NEAU-A123 TaxID=2839649 RepID=UPI001BE4C4A8|nr:DUF6232 family protein [Nonomuraea sp. NEAU-A123]MBT2234780.1 hypothetical protein [Nonomuraea sp. NEAU-A123]